LPIHYFTEDINYTFRLKRKTSELIRKILEIERFTEGIIAIILCSDSFLHDMNLKYLGKDDYTDIITFNYNEKRQISGDLFISVDRVRENSEIHHINKSAEMQRVIIHGILHLIGYDDKNLEQQKIIRSKEDFYLNF
jgi:probable rRNA maturation factor